TGMNCHTASNGEEALEKLRKHDFHLVLTDTQMPKMDGFACMEALRDHPEISNIPVIAISGRTNVSAEKYKEAGFAGNILKPYKPSDLLFKIGQIFNVDFKNRQEKDREPTVDGSEYSLDEIFLFAGEDQMALDTILNAFIQSTRLNLEEIKKAEKLGDQERIAQIAHRMLPMFKQLKIKDIVPRLEQLEKKEGNFYAMGSMDLLIEEIEVLLFELQKEVKA